MSPHPHVAAHEEHSVGDLAVQRSRDGPRIELRRTPVHAAVVRRGDAGVRKPRVGFGRAEQDPRNGGLDGSVRGCRQQGELLKRTFRVRPPFGTQHRLPERLLKRPKSGLGDGLFVEPQKTRLPAPLGQTQLLVGRHLPLGPADAHIAAAGTPVEGVALRDLGGQNFPVRQRQVLRGDPHRRLDGIGAQLDQHLVERRQFVAREILHVPVVGDAAEQDATAGVRERGDLVGQRVTFGAPHPLAGELDLLEFPAAVLTCRDLFEDFLGGEVHVSRLIVGGQVANCHRSGSTPTAIQDRNPRT